MADGVAGRLRSSGIRAVTITLKLRDSAFTTITRQTSLEVPADLTEPIFEAALTLLRRELHGQRIRLVGVTASNFRDREQLAMFEAAERSAAARGGGGARQDPAQVRRPGGHAGASRPDRAARAVRAGPDAGRRTSRTARTSGRRAVEAGDP